MEVKQWKEWRGRSTYGVFASEAGAGRGVLRTGMAASDSKSESESSENVGQLGAVGKGSM